MGCGQKAVGGASAAPATKRRKRAAPEVEAETDEAPGSFELGVTVDAGNLDRLFGTFDLQEKANAVAGVIQARMDALLEV